jgi:hypothetical protein
MAGQPVARRRNCFAGKSRQEKTMFTNPYLSGELARDRQHELMEASRRHRLARQFSAPSGTASRRGRRLGVLALAAAAVGVALALTACGGPSAPSGSSGPGGQVANRQGSWVGPVPGDAGDCGTGSGTWTFGPGSNYTFQGSYDNCAGVTDTGTYQVQGNVINFSPQGIQPFSASFSFPDGDLQLCDDPGTQCYTYSQS